ncbi:MarR family transcriptional regulator [Altibacter sp.]|uniref:MarR family winged helix-turn-helix transcriptional regulator n=1 Tax=Altibacter sp. TaxID=2024823 RepID=UPI002582BC36|nr:MarR family transcriptional regulator [Altibacter sp.]MCW9038226.1 MarR family transcriptional regulator [Altibacter sp.]
MKIEDVIQSKAMSLPTKTVINMAYTSSMVEETILAVLKPYDLSIQQYNVLRILRGQKGNPANLSTIQERMVDRNSNTTRLVDKLIKKGWVRRQICKNNRRKVEIFITEKGMETLQELDPLTEGNNKALLDNLSETELDTLNRLLDKLRKDEH